MQAVLFSVADIEAAILNSGITMGESGEDGATPVLSVQVDGDRRVHELEGHLDADGVFTALDSVMYVGPDGYTATLADAVDVRGGGGAAGPDGVGNSNSRGPLVGLATISAGNISVSSEYFDVVWSNADHGFSVSSDILYTHRLYLPVSRAMDGVLGLWLVGGTPGNEEHHEAFVPWHGPTHDPSQSVQIDNVKIVSDNVIQIRIEESITSDEIIIAIRGISVTAYSIPDCTLSVYLAVAGGSKIAEATSIIDDPAADGESLSWSPYLIKSAVETWETPTAVIQSSGVVMNEQVYSAIFYQKSVLIPNFTSRLTEEDGQQFWDPDLGSWNASRLLANLSPTGSMWIVYASGKRNLDGTYTHNIPTIVAEFGVQYTNDGGATTTDVAPTANLDSWQQRSRLPDASFTPWQWIGRPSTTWNSLIASEAIYVSSLSRSVYRERSLNLNNVTEFRMRLQPFGRWLNGVTPDRLSGYAEYIIPRPGDNWPSTIFDGTGGFTSAEFTVIYDELYGLNVIHQDSGSFDDIIWPSVNDRPHNYPSRNSAYMMRFIASGISSLHLMTGILFWNWASTYNRALVSLDWR